MALVLGDVRGKGAPAATVMGQVRAALRAYAVLDPDPAAVLARLDRFMGEGSDLEEIATVAYAVLDPATGVLEHASAGHLPVVVRAPDGAAVRARGRGRPPARGRRAAPHDREHRAAPRAGRWCWSATGWSSGATGA